MSYWKDIKNKDIEIDTEEKEVTFYITSDDNGNIYGVFTFKQILDIAEKIKNSK